MPTKASNTQQTSEAAQKRAAAKPAAQEPVVLTQQADPETLQRAIADPRVARPSDIVALQRTVGNQAVMRLIQTKLTVGPAGDRYEQEADRVAEQVLSMPAPISRPPAASGKSSPVQRAAEEEEEVQTKPLAASITPLVQRQPEEEEVQTKLLVQREAAPEEEEVQTKLLVQREAAPEEEEIQTRPSAQRASEGGFEVGSNVEARLAVTRGGGSPLPAETREFMETRFGADFSSVRVHTGSEAAQLNRAVSAQAFTLGQDIYLGEGKYDPGTDTGKRLLAHELAHTIQQTGPSNLQRVTPRVTLRNIMRVIQRWVNTVQHATVLRDAGRITIFDDRIQHIIDEHGKTTGKVSPLWAKLYTDDPKIIKGYVEGVLKYGTPKLGERSAYDFEAGFTGPIGETSTGTKATKMRVVVVELGRSGSRGKVQTAYPIL
jgi:hypothetical protein